MTNAECRMSNVECRMLNERLEITPRRDRTLFIQHSTFRIQHSHFSVLTSVYNPPVMPSPSDPADLEFTPDDMRRMGNAVIERAVAHIASLGEQPIRGDVDA